MNTLLKQEKNENQHIISCLSGNPAECKSLLNIMPLDSRVKPENDREMGRSMVEMLGVLAVMGVLSVAGIAGYNNAMNRHRANELLNEASKRAVVVAGQVTMGGRTPSLSEFTNPTGYTFDVKGPDGTKAWASGDNQFTLTITGVSEAVCNHMQNMKTALIQKFEPTDCATTATVKLTYNADLSVENSSAPSGGNESGTTTPACDPACTGGKECVADNTCECKGTMYCPNGEDEYCIEEEFECCPEPKKVVCTDITGRTHCLENTCCPNGIGGYYIKNGSFVGRGCCMESEPYLDIDDGWAYYGTPVCISCKNGTYNYDRDACVCPEGKYYILNYGGVCTPCTNGTVTLSDTGDSYLCTCYSGNHWDDSVVDCVPNE